MKSSTSSQFWLALRGLPSDIQRQARSAFELFLADPFHPSLHFKQLDRRRNLWSVRIGPHFRALGYRDGDDIVWHWIGGHDEYERRIGSN